MSSQLSTLPRRGLNARQAETVEKLLAAAERELADSGTDALTIRTVAGRAGVSPATAYTYFGSKNHLFAELFHRKVLLAQTSGALAAVAALRELSIALGVLIGAFVLHEAAARKRLLPALVLTAGAVVLALSI